MRILSETEAAPASRPALDGDLFTAVGHYDPDGNSLAAFASYHASQAPNMPLGPIWERIEAYTKHRWGVRDVVWIVEGPGTFEAPLQPLTVTSTEVWKDDAWTSVTLTPSPLGHVLEDQTYRITASVGTADTPPAAVQEAIRRLAMYTVNLWRDSGGATSYGEVSMPASWPARSMQYSGAADLLRPWRRLGAYHAA